ncbi:MAG: folate family ECF transporter S component [Ruminococcaceae bacterium]|nr:folate family ECF transporter S component [Oscillospiraceae bacterium]
MSRETRKKRILKLSVCAMLIGISVVVGALCRTYLTFSVFVRITFENLPIILSGILFGPVYGLVVGASTDLISSVISSQDINPIITVGALSVGLVSGLVSEMGNMLRANKTLKKIIAVVSAHFVGCLIIKTFGLQVYYFPTTSFWYLFAIRAGVYAFICVAETFIILRLLKNKFIKGFSNYEL